MIEFLDKQTMEPVYFKYEGTEYDAALFSANLFDATSDRIARQQERQMPDEIVRVDLNQAQEELLEGQLLTTHTHMFMTQRVLPVTVRLYDLFQTSAALNPDVAYGEVCDRYGVNADLLTKYVPVAKFMMRNMPEVQFFSEA